MNTGQIIAFIGLIVIIGLAVYRGVWTPWIQSKQNRRRTK
jgi:hypothetical protein